MVYGQTLGWIGRAGGFGSAIRAPGLAGSCSAGGAVGAAALGVTPSVAATGHEFVSSLSEAPAGTALGNPPLSLLTTRAVMCLWPILGVVWWMSSARQGRIVTQFGEGLEPVGLAVDEASGDVYVAEPVTDGVLVFKPNG